MTVRLSLTLVLLACTDPAEPLPTPSSAERVVAAVDTLNIAIRAFHANGGRIDLLQLLYLDAIPPDPTIPPVVVIVLRTP
jgi:hypothetical protein